MSPDTSACPERRFTNGATSRAARAVTALEDSSDSGPMTSSDGLSCSGTVAPMPPDARHQRTGTIAEREALQRIHAVRVVAAALEDGRWPLEVAVLDALALLVTAASRDALAHELEMA